MTTTASTNNALRSLAKQAVWLRDKWIAGDITTDAYSGRRITFFGQLAQYGDQVLAEEAAPPLRQIVVSGARCDCKEKAEHTDA